MKAFTSRYHLIRGYGLSRNISPLFSLWQDLILAPTRGNVSLSFEENKIIDMAEWLVGLALKKIALDEIEAAIQYAAAASCLYHAHRSTLGARTSQKNQGRPQKPKMERLFYLALTSDLKNDPTLQDNFWRNFKPIWDHICGENSPILSSTWKNLSAYETKCRFVLKKQIGEKQLSLKVEECKRILIKFSQICSNEINNL